MTEIEQAREFVRFTQGLTTEQQAAAYLITEGRVELARLQGKIKKQPRVTAVPKEPPARTFAETP